MTLVSPATRAWQAERGRLIGIAYRMLGDYGHAEDIVSEVAIEALQQERAERPDPDGSGADGYPAASQVRSWPAWLTTVCVRRSIDRVRALAAMREDYVGPWLPEPVATSRLPEDAVADRELLSLALLHMAEQLAPEARAAIVLHRAFGMSAVEIAPILEKSPAAVRQLVSRGERRLRLADDPSVTRAADPAALGALLAAVEHGDVSGVLALLSDDAILWNDGGGKVSAARNPIFGADRVRRFLVGVLQKATADPALPFSVRRLDINGEPAIAFLRSGRTDVLALEFGADGLIHGLRQVCNPDKLAYVL
ncbi:MAG: sigma-70 family RNA polymerase sigma factor [Microbacterium sp.]|jgi:RNA polymerase sigma-70 factor (ECF subfamily)|uniref:sigma-70 family RNA polymerase sigma factor n=1 Tax=Microbacterium sp. TaxID=51671 RepID=UPI00283A04D7|nr:sigma-70 family RNA polymerase sigma factor [Microbacterium sp.]MDR2320590.1 sigma-70 family RNA polymerase sigma factor [Microbacterium sp.]